MDIITKIPCTYHVESSSLYIGQNHDVKSDDLALNMKALQSRGLPLPKPSPYSALLLYGTRDWFMALPASQPTSSPLSLIGTIPDRYRLYLPLLFPSHLSLYSRTVSGKNFPTFQPQACYPPAWLSLPPRSLLHLLKASFPLFLSFLMFFLLYPSKQDHAMICSS